MNTDDKFHRIYGKYKNMVLKLGFDMTSDYHLSQDICQETFLKLYGYQDHIDENRVRSWLMVVAANMIRDYYRKGGKYKEVLNYTEEFVSVQDRENNIDAYLDRLELKELRNRMLEALRLRNPDWYEVFILAEYLDVPRKLIAKQRGIALSTVDSYLRKSKKWMKDNFAKEYEEL